MRKLYTGSFGPAARKIWVKRAVELIRKGKAGSFLFILPTAALLKEVRDQLLYAVGAVQELNLLTFDDIAEKVVEHTHPGAGLLTPYETLRLYEQLLEQHEDHKVLQELSRYAHFRGVKLSLIHMTRELKRSGLTVEQAGRLMEADAGNGTGARQRALAFLYMEVEKALQVMSDRNGSLCLTPETRLELAAELLEEASGVPAWLNQVETVWMDHYTDVTPLQLRLLERVIRRDTVQHAGIYLPYQEDVYTSLPHLHQWICGTIASLEALGLEHCSFGRTGADRMVSVLERDWDADNNGQMLTGERDSGEPHMELVNLDQLLFADGGGELLDPPERIRTVPCASRKQEIRTAAKLIKQTMLADQSLRLEDAALIVRDKAGWLPLIGEVFAEEEIPLQSALTTALAKSPLVRELLSFLQAAVSNWHRDDLLKLQDGIYVSWQHRPPEGTGRWIRQCGIISGQQAWQKAARSSRETQQQGESTVYDWLREIRDRLSVFPRQAAFRDFLQAAAHWLDGLQLQKRLFSLHSENDSKRLLKRDLEAVAKVQESIGQLWASAERLGELGRVLSFSQFVREWSEGWQEETVVTAGGHPRGVRVLEPSAARGLRFKHVYVLGLNEGEFPRTHRESWLLDDGERLLMHEEAELPASHFHNEMEQIFFQMALGLPTERITFTWISREVDESSLTSPFLESLFKIFPQAWKDRQERSALEDFALNTGVYPQTAEMISTKREYALWLFDQGRKELAGAPQLYRKNWLPQQVFRHILGGIRTEHIRSFEPFSAWDGFLDDPRLVEDLRQRFSPLHPFSVSQLNEYMNSPLTFFFKRVLGVYPSQQLDWEVSKLDKGNLLHETLRRFYTLHRGERVTPEMLPACQEELSGLLREEAGRFAKGTIYEDSGLWKLEIQRLQEELSDWLAVETARAGTGDLRPQFLEFSFGLPLYETKAGELTVDPASQEEPVILSLPGGLLQLVGKVDRIDMDDEGHFMICDYKSGLSAGAGYDELYKGLRTVQMPLYLAAVRSFLQDRGVADPQAVGGVFLSLRRRDGFKKVGMWEKQYRELAGVSTRTVKGVFDSLEEGISGHLAEVGQALAELRAGRFYLSGGQQPDPYYAGNAVYRFDRITLRVKEKLQQEGVAGEQKNLSN